MNLTGKRIVITRPRAQAEEFAKALTAEGAHPIFFPVIEIVPPDDFSALDCALQNLDQYDWLILTSVHGVNSFFKRLETHGIEQIPTHLQVAAVGSKTAKCLSEYRVVPDYVPTEFIADAILYGLGENILGKRFLLPQSNIALKSLANRLRCAGSVVDEVIAYRTVMNHPHESEINSLCSGVDIVTFTSPSAVRNFIDIVGNNGLDQLQLPGNPLFVCIGPITRKVAEEAGFVDLVEANEHTTTGLIEAMGKLVRS